MDIGNQERVIVVEPLVVATDDIEEPHVPEVPDVEPSHDVDAPVPTDRQPDPARPPRQTK